MDFTNFDEKKNDRLRKKFLKRMDSGEFDSLPGSKSSWFLRHRFIIEKYWDFITNGSPDQYTYNDKTWWYCNTCQQHWEQVASYKRDNEICPVCSGKTVISGYNDFTTLHPEIAEQWLVSANGEIPANLHSCSHMKVRWKCSACDSEWNAAVDARVRGSGCPVCAGRVVKPGYNDLESKFPNIATEWDYEKNELKPNEVTSGSTKRVWWICPNGHSYDMKISDRTTKLLRYNCPYCSHQRVEEGVSDLASKHPELLEEWDYNKNNDIGLFPDKVAAGSTKRAWWICKACRHSWQAQIVKRAIEHRGCPVCSGNKVVAGINDLATKFPDIAAEWDYEANELLPSQVTPHSNKKVYWRCPVCNGKWDDTINHRTDGRKCPYCNNQKLLIGFNDVATRRPDLLEEWDYEDNDVSPNEVPYYTNKKAHWICPHGHKYEASIASRAKYHTGCNKCHKGQQDSIFERFLYRVAIELFGYENVIPHDMEAIGMELDIYIPSINLALEPGSWFWHSHKTENDNRKYNDCKEKNINLIIIHNGTKDEKISVDYPCIIVSDDLGVFENREKAFEVAQQIFSPYVEFAIPPEKLYDFFEQALQKKIDMRTKE